MTLLTLPVAEHFHSIQGEGQYTGTAMHFIRLAGCNVGKLPMEAAVQWETGVNHDFPKLKTGRVAYRCHTYDGRGFWCDTDFQHGEPETFEHLLVETWEHHVCLTGGEPLLHLHVMEFVDACRRAGRLTHIETSGTVYWEPTEDLRPHVWITVSPKAECLDEMLVQADEIKLLVDAQFDINRIPEPVHHHKNVYIQPVNEELGVNMANLNLCLELLKHKPNWQLSVQLQKCFNWR